MPTLSTKENFMRLITGQMPEYIPDYDMMWSFNVPPFMFGQFNPDGVSKDMFGVEQVRDSGGIVPASMPKTHDFVLTDITKWRDVVKLPDTSDFDWAAAGKAALDMRNPELPSGGMAGMGFFQPLVGLMGFDEGLCACFEEPEEVKALMEYICDFYVDAAKNLIYYYKVDFGAFGDDIAHERNPFLSLEMFQDLIAPYWRRYYAVFAEAGLPAGMHNCGHFELYLDDLVDMGVTFWDPVQNTNDMVAIKDKFGRRLAMCEAYDARFLGDADEEEVRASFREHLNKVAPGGGYALFNHNPDMMLAFNKDEIEKAGWAWDEFNKLRYDFYK